MAIFAGKHRHGRSLEKITNFQEKNPSVNGFGGQGRTSANGSLMDFFLYLATLCVQAGEEGWVNFLRPEFDLLVFILAFFYILDT